MNALLGLLIPALLGVDYGWERKPDGSIAYVLQVDPETFAEMQKNGQSIGSALPASLRGRVSDLSFRVGRQPLPNQNTLPPEMPLPQTSSTPAGDVVQVNADKPVGPTATYMKTDYQAASYANDRYSNSSPTPMPQATSANWGGTPNYQPPATSPPNPFAPTYNNNSTTSAPATSAGASWSQTTIPASSSTTQPLSTSGFPMNPNALPPPPSNNGTYPMSSGNVAQNPSTAWPATTAPPSLSNGPRLSQPQPWSTPPREVTISARTPIEPNGPANGNMTQNGSNLNSGVVPTSGNYPTNNQPGYGNPSGYGPNGYPNNGGYGQPSNPQLAQNNYGGTGTQQNFPTPNGPLPNGATPPNGQFYAANQPMNLPPPPGQQQQPQSASQTPPPVTQATTNAVAKTDTEQWLPLTLVLIGFLTSMAANFYFGWSTYQLRERCRMLLSDRGAF
jgi:hypothetical protein